jgi:hypothetical protein
MIPADGWEVDGMIGRAPGRQQADGGVDDRFLVDAARQRAIIVAVPADLAQPVHGGAGQFLAKLGAGIDEGRAGQVEAHHLHHHLVRICGAVEGAGAGAVIAGRFCFQQLLAPDLAFRIKLPDALLFLVGKAGRHRPSGDEDGR